MKNIFKNLGLFALGFIICLSFAFNKPQKTIFMKHTEGYNRDSEVMKIVSQKAKEGYSLISIVSYQKNDSNNSYFLITMEK